MDLAIFQAWALALGGLSSLGSALIVMLLLNRKAGPGSAFAFAGGYFGSYLSIGMLVVFVGPGFVRTDTDGEPSLGPAIAMLVLGALLMAAAIAQWRKPPSGEPPALFAKLDEFRPPKALLVAIVLPVINVKNLAMFLPAVAVLASAELDAPLAALAVLSTAMIFCGGLLTPVLIYLLVPRRAEAWLGAMRSWIEANSTTVARVILPLIACMLLAKGGRVLWQLYGA